MADASESKASIEEVQAAIQELLEVIRLAPDKRTFQALVASLEGVRPGRGVLGASRLFAIAGVKVPDDLL